MIAGVSGVVALAAAATAVAVQLRAGRGPATERSAEGRPRTPEETALAALGASQVELVQTSRYGELWLGRNGAGGVCVMVRPSPEELQSSCVPSAPPPDAPLISFSSRVLGSSPNLVSGYVPGAVGVRVGEVDAPLFEDTFLVEVPSDVWGAQVTMGDGSVVVIDRRPG